MASLASHHTGIYLMVDIFSESVELPVRLSRADAPRLCPPYHAPCSSSRLRSPPPSTTLCVRSTLPLANGASD